MSNAEADGRETLRALLLELKSQLDDAANLSSGYGLREETTVTMYKLFRLLHTTDRATLDAALVEGLEPQTDSDRFKAEHPQVIAEAEAELAADELLDLERRAIRTGCETDDNRFADMRLRALGYRFNASEARWEKTQGALVEGLEPTDDTGESHEARESLPRTAGDCEVKAVGDGYDAGDLPRAGNDSFSARGPDVSHRSERAEVALVEGLEPTDEG